MLGVFEAVGNSINYNARPAPLIWRSFAVRRPTASFHAGLSEQLTTTQKVQVAFQHGTWYLV